MVHLYYTYTRDFDPLLTSCLVNDNDYDEHEQQHRFWIITLHVHTIPVVIVSLGIYKSEMSNIDSVVITRYTLNWCTVYGKTFERSYYGFYDFHSIATQNYSLVNQQYKSTNMLPWRLPTNDHFPFKSQNVSPQKLCHIMQHIKPKLFPILCGWMYGIYIAIYGMYILIKKKLRLKISWTINSHH